jgi:protein SCO1/2
MNKLQKILTTVLWCLVIVGMVGFVVTLKEAHRNRSHASAASTEQHDPINFLKPMFQVPDFTLTDQEAQPATLEQFKGKVWVAAFVFTRCAGPCPMMTKKMSTLQTTIRNPNVKLVTFTVDPQHDTAPILKQYAKDNDANPERWTFLTGDLDTIYAVANGMKLAAQPATEESPIIHSEKFVLIGRDGWVRGYYSGTDDADLARLAEDAEALASQP